MQRRGARARARAVPRSASRARSRAASASASRWAARSCAQPQAFLMDEPLSNLDAKLRVQMRAEIARLQRDLGVTTIYVTHDQIEAMTMGDRVAVMRKGELQQVDDAAGALRPPGQSLRRRLHRQPGHEHASRRRCEPRRWRHVRGRRQPAPLARRARGSRPGPRSRPTTARPSCSASGRRIWRTRRSRPTRPPTSRLHRQGRADRGARLRDDGALHGRCAAGCDRGRARARGGRGDDRARGGTRGRRRTVWSVASGPASRVSEGTPSRSRSTRARCISSTPSTGLGIYDDASMKGAAT